MRLWRFMWQEVPDIGEDPPLVGTGGVADVAGAALHWVHAVYRALQRDRRHGDRRALRETRLNFRDRWVTRCGAVAVAVGVDDYIDEVGMIEAPRGALEGRVVKAPRRRPLLPQ